MLIGHMRVSSADERQSVSLQRDALLGACVDVSCIIAKPSSAGDDRPGLKACFSWLKECDTLVVWKRDRLERSLPHLSEIVADLWERGVTVRFLTEHMDTAAGQVCELLTRTLSAGQLDWLDALLDTHDGGRLIAQAWVR